MACILRYYSAWGGTNPGVGVAYSEFPSGPFRDVLGGPVMPGNDPTIFIDPDDPSVRVLCSNVRPDQSLGNYGPLCGTLANDMVTWEQQPAIMAGFNKTTWRFFEAPWLHKMDDKYYLSFMMEGTFWPDIKPRLFEHSHLIIQTGTPTCEYETATKTRCVSETSREEELRSSSRRPGPGSVGGQA